MSARNEIDVDSNPAALIGTRLIDAPRDLVFQAWSDPIHLSKWWGPDGFTTTTKSFDFRTGGVWRFTMHGPDGRDYENRITYEEIIAPERIVYVHGGGEDVEPVQFKTIASFEDLGEATRLTMHMQFANAAERNRVIAEYGADKGLAETMNHLADYVATL